MARDELLAASSSSASSSSSSSSFSSSAAGSLESPPLVFETFETGASLERAASSLSLTAPGGESANEALPSPRGLGRVEMMASPPPRTDGEERS